jgi:hypothetical protein
MPAAAADSFALCDAPSTIDGSRRLRCFRPRISITSSEYCRLEKSPKVKQPSDGSVARSPVSRK